MQEGKNRTGGRISCLAPAAWLPDWLNLDEVTVELEAEYLGCRRQPGSKTDLTLCGRGRKELEAEYLARRRHPGSKTYSNLYAEGKK
jgi:hypothetical protein